MAEPTTTASARLTHERAPELFDSAAPMPGSRGERLAVLGQRLQARRMRRRAGLDPR